MLMSPVFKPFMMLRHCCCDVVTLNVDMTFLLRLCFDVGILSCDAVTLTWSSVVLCDVATDVLEMS